jgi:hypothetical protein
MAPEVPVGESDLVARVAALETKIAELESVQQLLLRLLSTQHPLDNLLDFYGATESARHDLHQFLDELLVAVRGPKPRQPTLAYFRMRLGEIFPAQKGDSAFVQAVIDTLGVERPAYRELHGYMTSQGWGRS